MAVEPVNVARFGSTSAQSVRSVGVIGAFSGTASMVKNGPGVMIDRFNAASLVASVVTCTVLHSSAIGSQACLAEKSELRLAGKHRLVGHSLPGRCQRNWCLEEFGISKVAVHVLHEDSVDRYRQAGT